MVRYILIGIATFTLYNHKSFLLLIQPALNQVLFKCDELLWSGFSKEMGVQADATAVLLVVDVFA